MALLDMGGSSCVDGTRFVVVLKGNKRNSFHGPLFEATPYAIVPCQRSCDGTVRLTRRILLASTCYLGPAQAHVQEIPRLAMNTASDVRGGFVGRRASFVQVKFPVSFQMT